MPQLVLLQALSEALYLFADMEDNTRRVAALLERRLTLDQETPKQ